ncbi:diaminopimelate decarboxylase [Lentilactobacillus kosonis]|uniref:Diaminopimelate decarboxylase n=1 Tax=Lentilactobacillus kosonis TaxID=2810561 RepID=A0A401FMQ7_9LACO|nr:diaminopimelate decarboxylase [Lentilactobacillus kosonis]
MAEQEQAYQINEQGHVEIGGVDSLKLASQFGTPLVAYDVSAIRNQIHHFQSVFEQNQVDYAVSYASKAFACIAMFQLVNEERGHIDVVSGGELYTAVKAGFPMNHVSFHGNNKSVAELEMAVEHQVGVIILDNFMKLNCCRKFYNNSISISMLCCELLQEFQLTLMSMTRLVKLIVSLALIFKVAKHSKPLKRS